MKISINSLEKLLVGVAKLALLVLMVLITLDTILRYIFNSPITGVHQVVSEILMIILVYFTISHIFAIGGHIRIDFFAERFSDRTRAFLEVFFDLLTVVFWILVVYIYGVKIIDKLNEGIPSTVGFNVPTIYPYIIILVGAFILTLRLLTDLLKQLRYLRSSSN